MNLRNCLQVIYMCGASITIGSVAALYLLGTWIYQICCTRGISFMLTIVSVLVIYAYGFWFLLAVTKDSISYLQDETSFIFEIFSKDQINPYQTPNFEGIFDAVWLISAYFIAMGAFFTIFFYMQNIITDSMSNIKFFLKSLWYQKWNNNASSFCSICLSQSARFQLDCGHSFHFNCIQKWKIQKNTCPYCRAIIQI